jgi:putative DNA primase/helicase
VDLRTGELVPHDPAFMMTKVTEVPYVPGARSRDWDQCMDALDPDVMQWMQMRWGQGATGWPTSDDVLPVLQGSGSNGKSTQMMAVQRALGEHMTQVPAKLVMANPSDHPTELMTLRGARVAYIDETPEAATLNVARLKAVLGQEYVTARAIRQDNVTWRATHSLFLSTNYVPNIHETDHGTWRRLALVRFEKKYERDERFRTRVARGAGGIAEAVLAWVVDGARAWYDADMVMAQEPTKVHEDTLRWRIETDLVLAYLDECVVFEDGVAVASTDLFENMNEWLKGRRQKVWSDKTASSRLKGHEVINQNGVYQLRLQSKTEEPGVFRVGGERLRVCRPANAVESLPGKPWVWVGMRLLSDVSDNGE